MQTAISTGMALVLNLTRRHYQRTILNITCHPIRSHIARRRAPSWCRRMR